MNSFELFAAFGELPLETVAVAESGTPRRRIVASIVAVLSLVIVLQIAVWVFEANNRPTPHPVDPGFAPGASIPGDSQQNEDGDRIAIDNGTFKDLQVEYLGGDQISVSATVTYAEKEKTVAFVCGMQRFGEGYMYLYKKAVAYDIASEEEILNFSVAFGDDRMNEGYVLEEGEMFVKLAFRDPERATYVSCDKVMPAQDSGMDAFYESLAVYDLDDPDFSEVWETVWLPAWEREYWYLRLTDGEEPVAPPEDTGETVGGIALDSQFPVTVFGLSPADAGTARLVFEDVSFTKLTAWEQAFYGYYDVELHYTVEISEKTSFVLPYAFIPTKVENMRTEIYVDGSDSQVGKHVEIHPNARIEEDWGYENTPHGHTVYIYPDHWAEDLQPANTYELLLQTWGMEESTPFPGYTVSDLIYESHSGYVQMNLFEIEGAGTHEIVIRLTGKGADFFNDYEAIEFAASPGTMWSEIGERNISIHLPDDQYTYPLPEELFCFTQLREADPTGTSAGAGEEE